MGKYPLGSLLLLLALPVYGQESCILGADDYQICIQTRCTELNNQGALCGSALASRPVRPYYTRHYAPTGTTINIYNSNVTILNSCYNTGLNITPNCGPRQAVSLPKNPFPHRPLTSPSVPIPQLQHFP